MSTYPVLRWVSISIWSVFLLFSSYILKKEINNRTKHKTKNDPLFASIYLSIFTLLALICSAVYPLFGLLGQFHHLCAYGYILGVIAFAGSIVCFGFYQLARLYYCFSQNKSHSAKGYSNGLFIFMYVIGFILLLNIAIFPWFTVEILKDQYGDCQLNPKDTFWYFVSIVLLFYVWDWTTLSLYIYKIWQFNKFTQDTNKQIVWKRIIFILSKIIVLTLCVEVFITLNAVTVIITVAFNMEEWWYIVVSFVSGWCSSLTSMTIYCMMEHNKDDYIKMLGVIEKVICFAFCKTLIRNATPFMESMENEIEIQKKTAIDVDETNTRDLPRQLSPNRPSEYTETVIDESLEDIEPAS